MVGVVPKDKNTVKWVATVTVVLTPLNSYGDVLSENGEFSFTKVIEVIQLTELAAILENIH